MITRVRRLWRDDEGATAIEYGLILALIALALLGALTALGSNNNAIWSGVFERTSEALDGARN